MNSPIKSYVLRAGRMTHRQQQGLEHLTDFSLPACETFWDLPCLFPTQSPLVLEIGFGMGGSLVAMAKQNPDINYIGIEVHRAGVGGLIASLIEQNISNVRVVMQDAVSVIEKNIPDEALAGIQIFFPDPWHKKRHHKRRLIQPEFVDCLVKKLQPGGFLHCATDWQDYAEHMLAVLSGMHSLENQGTLAGFAERPASRPLTKFEQRGTKLGHGVWDLMFKKVVVGPRA